MNLELITKGEIGPSGIGLKGEQGLKGVDGQKVSIFYSKPIYFCFFYNPYKLHFIFITFKKQGEKGSSINFSEVKKIIEVEIAEVVEELKNHFSKSNACKF